MSREGVIVPKFLAQAMLPVCSKTGADPSQRPLISTLSLEVLEHDPDPEGRVETQSGYRFSVKIMLKQKG